MSIIFIIESPFNLRDYHRFGIELLLQRGFNVEIWDLTPHLYPDFYKKYTPRDPINFINHIIIREKPEVENLLHGLTAEDTVIAAITINSESLYIGEYLSLKNVNYGTMALGTVPFLVTKKSTINKIKDAIRSPIQYLLKAYHLLTKERLNLPLINFIIIGGSIQKQAVIKREDFGEKTDIIDAHGPDYDMFLKEEQTSENRIIGRDYLVFIDECGPYHPDILRRGSDNDVNIHTYYTDINNFLDLIEDSLGIKVIIAAHPRAPYDKIGNCYGGREIIFGNTIRLVKYANIVLMHSSTAVNFAVLYSKPLILLSNSDYSKHNLNCIDLLGKTLSRNVLNISKCKHIPTDYLSIDKVAYKIFIDKYLKSNGSPQKNIWEIFADFIEQKQRIQFNQQSMIK